MPKSNSALIVICNFSFTFTALVSDEIVAHQCDQPTSPCKHNGECLRTGDEYLCQCQDGFTGKDCENRLIVSSMFTYV